MQHSNKVIDQILDRNKNYLEVHFEPYNNHVYRVFRLCQLLDEDTENAEKYAIASVFHDLGIWTNKTFDYLEPSIQLARNYLIEVNKEHWIEEISVMIDMHHKRSEYKGDFGKTVETFRKADWIDVTKGRITYNVGKDEIKKLTDEYPLLGFHRFLVVQTLKQFLKAPLNPLPMFKK